MQQTLMTLGALMIITMTSVNQQRSNFMMIEGTYIREQENAASDYVTMRLENLVNSMAYDESVVGSSDPIDVNTLTAKQTLGPDAGETKLAQYDDIDDFNGFTETISHALSADTFRFDVIYSVEYINSSNPTATASSPTLTKELTIEVASQDTIGYRVARYSGSKLVIGVQD